MWAWLKRWGGALFGAISALLLLVLGGGWLWRRKQSEVSQLRDALAVEEATQEIAKLRAVRAEIVARVGEKDEAVEAIDQQLAANRRAVVSAHESGEGLSDEEIADAFARLGF